MSISDWLTQTATLSARTVSYDSAGAERLGSSTLRAAGVACRVVPESPSTVRVFFGAGVTVWQQGDQELSITVGGVEYIARPNTANAILGLEYGEMDFGAGGGLAGDHIEVIAEVRQL